MRVCVYVCVHAGVYLGVFFVCLFVVNGGFGQAWLASFDPWSKYQILAISAS